MSVIQPILDHLQHEGDHAPSPRSSDCADGQDQATVSLRGSRLGSDASWYRENLGLCNEPMLQYEWAWMNGRIATLRHFHSSGGGASVRADGRAGEGSERSQFDLRLAELLSESQLFRTLLLQELSSRGITPMPAQATGVGQVCGIL